METSDGTGIKNPRARALLLVLLLVVLSATIVNRLGGDPADQRDEHQMVTEYSPRDLPELLEVSAETVTAERQNRSQGRDPFAFKALPPPPPPKSKTATKEGVKEELETTKVREKRVPKPAGPEFEWKYLGHFGPKYFKVAAFRKNDDVEIAILGQVVNDAFILRRIGPDYVALEVLGKPAADLMTILLGDD